MAIPPAFADSKGVERVYGIRRPLLYRLCNEGCITSVSLRRRGAQRGKRLFSLKSIDEFLRKQSGEEGGK